MPILQKLTKESFVIIYCQDLDSQTFQKIGLVPIDVPTLQDFDCSDTERVAVPKAFNSIKIMFGRSA
jgi:hypothetical protein